MKRLIFSAVVLVMVVCNALAATPDSVRYHHYDTDTATVNNILEKTRAANLVTPAERVVFIGKQFVGTPYKAATLEYDEELLTVNLSQMDCTTLVENVIALAGTAAVDTATFDDFVAKLQNIRYRNGVVDGYASRLHYSSDWVADNVKRGNLVEVTGKFPAAVKQSKRLDYISTHSRDYQALREDTAACQQIKDIEKQYNPCLFSYVPKNMIAAPAVQKNLKDGDILLITTSTKGLDVMHMGIVVFKSSKPFLLHATTKGNVVKVDSQPLAMYLSSLKSATGIRVVRVL